MVNVEMVVENDDVAVKNSVFAVEKCAKFVDK
jgi:hypothetical protein